MQRLFSWFLHQHSFLRALLVAMFLQIFLLLLVIMPWTRALPDDFSNELRPEFFEAFAFIWMLPLGFVVIFLENMGLYPGNEDTGLFFGFITVPFFSILFWALIFWILSRIVSFVFHVLKK